MTRNRHAINVLALSAALLGLLSYVAWLVLPYAGIIEWSMTGVLAGLGVMTVVACARRSASMRIWTAISLFAFMLCYVVVSRIKPEYFEVDPFPSLKYSLFIMGLLSFTCISLWRRWFFSRSMALAFATAGMASAAINLYQIAGQQWHGSWMLAFEVAGSAMVFANLIGNSMRAHFEEKAAPFWSSREPLARAMRWTMLALLVAVPLLLVYSWIQPIVPATQTSALVLAVFLGLSLVLALRQRVLGALGLVLGGVGLSVQTMVTVHEAHQMGGWHEGVSHYYAFFWGPAALLAIVTGGLMARPILRYLRS